jgi:hypothetical protein
MTVFFHIGHHKTGTSSIQATMYRNAALLRDRYSINYQTFTNNHWPFAIPFLSGETFSEYGTARTDPGRIAEAEQAVETLRRDAKKYRTHIVSAEDFFYLTRPTLEKLSRFFRENGLEAKIVAYIRHPAELASSQLNQSIIMGKATLGEFSFGTNFAKTCIENYVSVFGKDALTIRRFGEPYFTGGGLIEDFLSVVHPEEKIELPAVVFRNESLTAPALRLIDALNRIGPRGSSLRGEHHYLRKVAGPKFKATRDFVEAFARAQQGSLDYLAKEFDIRFRDVDLTQFPERASHEFSDETVASLAAILNAQSLRIARLSKKIDGLKTKGAGRRLRQTVRGLFGKA